MEPQQSIPAPEEPQAYGPKTRVSERLTVSQPGEQTVCEIHRHPIGMIGVYVGTGLLLIVLAVLAFLVAPHFVSNTASRSHVTLIGGLVFAVLAVLALGFVYISNKVYWGNYWVVTTDSITEVNRTGLFARQSAQLSLGNLEDVTAEQNGMLTHIFNFGLLRVETAGERSKFMFLYCPNPNYYAQQILSARENFEQRRRGEDQQRPYRNEGAFAAAPPQPVSPPPVPGSYSDGGYGPGTGTATGTDSDEPD